MVVVVMLVAAVIGAALVGLAEESIGRSRAQAVADLVALATASDPAAGARVAAANGGRLEAVRPGPSRDGGVGVTVVVRVAGRSAVAAAER